MKRFIWMLALPWAVFQINYAERKPPETEWIICQGNSCQTCGNHLEKCQKEADRLNDQTVYDRNSITSDGNQLKRSFTAEATTK